MTDYQRGCFDANTHINTFGLKGAIAHSETLRMERGRLDMYAIGFRTSVGVRMERMFD